MLGIRFEPALYAELEQAYGAPDRFYHDKTHVAECLKALGVYRYLAERVAEIEMAIWFHDAVYDSTRADNEAQSAAWATQALEGLGLAKAAVVRIDQMIMATASHAADNLDADAQLMLDIDLGILGASEAAFERYDANIRKEYAWVPEAQYFPRRAQVLRGFLERDAIYGTPALKAALEANARRNLARKVASLEAMSASA